MSGVSRPPWPGPFPRIEHHDELPNPVFFHECTDDRARRTVLPLGPDGWQWHQDGSLTPSIRCLECDAHGWWTAEGWREA